jgi:hypothetical protein
VLAVSIPVGGGEDGTTAQNGLTLHLQPPLPPAPAPTLLGRLAIIGAGLGGLTALGLTLKYLAQGLDGPGNFDLGGLIFLGAVLLVPLTPFVAVGAAASRCRETPMHVACLLFELLALASCWYYAQLAFRLIKPDALEAMTFLFLPVYQFAALGLCLGLGALIEHLRRRQG